MSWATILWSMSAAVSLTLGAIHFVVWMHDRNAWANLLFATMALSMAIFGGIDLLMMRAETVARYTLLHIWAHVPLFAAITSLLGFILFYFRTGRAWLAWTVIGMRVVVLVVDFTIVPTVNYRAITGLLPVPFLGETVSVPAAVLSPWSKFAEGSGLLLLLFIGDASVSLWRKGNANERRRAMVVGGSVSLFVAIAVVNAFRIHSGAVHGPYLVSLLFLLIVLAMGYELSRDVIRAARVADDLRESTESMGLAADAAQVAFWRWDIHRDVVWVSPNGRQLYGIPPGEVVRLQVFLDTVHPDDRETTRQVVLSSLEGDGLFRAEYRVVLPGGEVRWMGARGKVEFNGHRQPLLMRGVSIDITERKQAEAELAQRWTELAHLSRVNTMSELSGSLAHELHQPLGIILSNTQAAQDLVAQDLASSAEMSEILSDIVAADRRAGEIIQRLRAPLKRGEAVFSPLSLNEVIEDVLRLSRAELIARGVTLDQDLARDLPQATGDPVQLQQVVLNLVLNAADAMHGNAPSARRLHLTTARHGGMLRTSVRDEGSGLPADIDRLFEPFYTTKHHGLGMGLAICRSIIAAHQGRLWAEPHPAGGAVFHFELPVAGPRAPS